jgi:ATP-dependent RNA helicase RhlE
LATNGSLQLKKVTKLVVDEVDETLSLGFRHQLMRIFDFLPEKRQNMVFSATLSEEVSIFLDAHFTAPIRVEAARSGTPLTQINQIGYRVPNFKSKVQLLSYLLKNTSETSKVLVFVSSRTLADLLFEEIETVFGEKVGVIHSNKAQNFRFNTVANFQAGVISILIATDLIARGIDVSDVSHVINFDIPEIPENYIHRIGRTGRADKNGNAITFVTENESATLGAIEELMQQQLPFLAIPETVELSSELLEFEKPKVVMQGKLVKLKRPDEVGPAFHEKKAKNKKVNVRYDHKKAMMDKYGKPKRKRS